MNATPQERLQSAMMYAMDNRPKVGGFPFLAECLKKAGVQNNIWSLPSTQSIYIMDDAVLEIGRASCRERVSSPV